MQAKSLPASKKSPERQTKSRPKSKQKVRGKIADGLSIGRFVIVFRVGQPREIHSLVKPAEIGFEKGKNYRGG